MQKALFIAEKPSLKRTVEAVYNKHKGEIPYDITFIDQRGHLLTLKQPDELDEDLADWSWDTLPIHPEQHGGWQYKIIQDKKVGNFLTAKERYAKIKQELSTGDYDCIINAGDADQEGELLVRIVVSSLRVNLPILRYWSNDNTEKGVLNALKNLKDDLHDPMLINLLGAAYLRQHSDWRFGMNISRAATLKMNARVACGRVKTPILSIVCERENEIRDFKPSTKYGITAVYDEDKNFTGSMLNSFSMEDLEEKKGEKDGEDEETNETVAWFEDKQDAEDIISSLPSSGSVIAYVSKKVETFAPKLYKLATIQIEAGKRGMSGQDTLNVIQSLYDKGYLSYPRTDCEYITSNESFEPLLKACYSVPELVPFIKTIDTDVFAKVKKTKKWVNDKETEKAGHTALIPTYKVPNFDSFSPEEKFIYTLVCKRFVAIFLPPLVQNSTTMVAKIGDKYFRSTGKNLVDAGFSTIFGTKFNDTYVPVLSEGDNLSVEDYKIAEKVTTCPKRFTDALLISTCETPHKFLEDKKYKSLGKNLKIGTPATRSSIIEELIERDKYLQRITDKKTTYIVPTEIGMAIYENLKDCYITKIDMTGEWEVMLEDIRDGNVSPNEIDEKMKRDVEAMIEDIKHREMNPLKAGGRVAHGVCPECGGDILSSEKTYFCSNWKEKGCKVGAYAKVCDSKLTPSEFMSLIGGKTIKKKISNKGSSWTQELKYNFDEHKIEFVKGEKKGSSGTEIEYKCPNCGGDLTEMPKLIKCNGCSFKLWKSLGDNNKMLTDDQIKSFFENGDTGLISGIKSRNTGRLFNAHLVLNADKTGTTFEYE